LNLFLVVHPISSCASGVVEGGISVDVEAADDVGAGVTVGTSASTGGIGTATGVGAGAFVGGRRLHFYLHGGDHNL
jgi:hypothetical protein